MEYKDNRLGIEEQHLSEIFDIFYRASEASKGAGVGLCILKQAVEKMVVLPNKAPCQCMSRYFDW